MRRKITIRDINLHGTIEEAAQAFGCGISGEKEIQLIEPTVESAIRYPGAFLAWVMDAAKFGVPQQKADTIAEAVLERYKEMAAVARQKKASKKKPCATKAIDAATERLGLEIKYSHKKPWEERNRDYKKVQQKIGRKIEMWKLGLEEMP